MPSVAPASRRAGATDGRPESGPRDLLLCCRLALPGELAIRRAGRVIGRQRLNALAEAWRDAAEEATPARLGDLVDDARALASGHGIAAHEGKMAEQVSK